MPIYTLVLICFKDKRFMKVISQYPINPKDYSYSCSCKVYYIHVKIEDITEQAKILKNDFLDKSWINSLDIATQKSYETRANATISKLIKNVLDKVDNKITEEFGEILVSTSAKDVLCTNYNHKKIPLAELWKEKASGNPGFDFHTETPTELIAFGEAKYRNTINAYSFALEQIKDFIQNKKDLAELSDLKNFIGKKALSNITSLNLKAFIAAFSLHTNNDELIINHIMQNSHIRDLLRHPELYIIGVET